MTLINTDSIRIRQRALDNALRELDAMNSELTYYREDFTADQILAMQKAMRALRNFIKTLGG